MALAKKCDRCGKLHEHYPKGSTIQYNAVRRTQVRDDGIILGQGDVIDLCEDCMAEFDKFMTSGGRFDDKT